MIVFVVILFSTLQVFVVQCKLTIIEPTIPQYEKSTKSVIYMLGSMTPYYPPSQTFTMLKSCTAEKAMVLMRHGPKHPKKTVMENFKRLENIKNRLIEIYPLDNKLLNNFPESLKVIPNIRIWDNQMSNAEPKSTNMVGNSTVENLGKRWNAKLNNLGNDIKIGDIKYQSAIQKRCYDSGIIFLQGFLEYNTNNTKVIDDINNKVKVNINNEVKDNINNEVKDNINNEVLNNVNNEQSTEKPQDNLIQLKKVDKNKLKVQDKSQNLENAEDVYLKKMCPPENCDLVEKIQKLLFPNHTNELIDMDLIKTMYLACANSYSYEYSDDVRGHAWCHVFDYKDLEMFEGMYDVQYFYKNGYHNKEMANVGHPMMKYMLEFLSDKGTKKLELFSAHTANCLSLITGFRLFRDKDKLTVEKMTTGDKMKNRKWRTSFIANYACNIAVAVYNCSSNSIDSKKVSIYFNEIPLTMQYVETNETCTQCPIEDVKELIQTLLNDEIVYDNE